MKTLIVIDMQKDFIDGSLGTKEAQAIVPNVAAKIKEYEKLKIFRRVVFVGNDCRYFRSGTKSYYPDKIYR